MKDDQQDRVLHPAHRGTPLFFMVVCLVLGVVLVNSQDGLGTVVATVLGATAFVGLLILFAVYWVGWLMYGHAVWLRQQDEDLESDA